MEKGCGKVCGECGKVRVFNRYFGGLEFLHRSGTMYIPMHNLGWHNMAMTLCCRETPEFSSESLAKKLAIFQKEGDWRGGAREMLKNICENSTKRSVV